ncbi:hypothetical protein C7820_1191 [Paenibacillus sp. VMFN-D1]|nr:hypothetical protein C7820_1191 [Paenibacillus sp. VMFN-D1]
MVGNWVRVYIISGGWVAGSARGTELLNESNLTRIVE